MAAAPGFEADFEQFLRWGRIGPCHSIQLTQDITTWGETVEILAYSTGPGVLSARAFASGRVLAQWRVDGDRVVQWCVREQVVLQLHGGGELLAEAQLRVAMPAAHVGVQAAVQALRFEPCNLPVHIRFATDAHLAWRDGPQHPLALRAPDEATQLQLPLPTTQCGRHAAVLSALGLNGQWTHQEIVLQVLPRPVQSTSRALGNGRTRVEVRHAQVQSLHLPLLDIQLPVLANTFEVDYAGAQPMLAHVRSVDDAGNVQDVAITLHNTFEWQRLPTFEQALGWTA